MLPIWFIHNDIDWLRYYPIKDGKIYKCNTEKISNKMIKEEKVDNFSSYIYDDEKVNIHNIFVRYLTYINNINMVLNNDITDEEMKKLLSIKVCNYDWLFMWSNPIYDKNSEELLLQKILDKNNTKSIATIETIIELYNDYEDFYDFVITLKEKNIDIGKNYFCIKEYGFNIKIIDKNSENIYDLFF